MTIVLILDILRFIISAIGSLRTIESVLKNPYLSTTSFIHKLIMNI